MLRDYILKEFGIDEKVLDFCLEAEKSVKHKFAEIDDISEFNQYKVLRAMQKNGLNDTAFNGTTGYGYNDIGRDKLEDIYASVFNTEAALVRAQIISGTHALTVALFGNLRYGDAQPTDTMPLIANPYKAMESGLFAPLDSYMKQDDYWDKSSYNSAFLETGKYNDKQYILPLTFTGELLLSESDWIQKPEADNLVEWLKYAERSEDTDLKGAFIHHIFIILSIFLTIFINLILQFYINLSLMNKIPILKIIV